MPGPYRLHPNPQPIQAGSESARPWIARQGRLRRDDRPRVRGRPRGCRTSARAEGTEARRNELPSRSIPPTARQALQERAPVPRARTSGADRATVPRSARAARSGRRRLASAPLPGPALRSLNDRESPPVSRERPRSDCRIRKWPLPCRAARLSAILTFDGTCRPGSASWRFGRTNRPLGAACQLRP